MSLKVTSTAFLHGERIPRRYTCEGEDASPPLAWTEGPPGTRSYAVVCRDPDAPGGIFYHWGLWGIPAAMHSLPAGFGNAEHTGVHQANNDFRAGRYRGPCPPRGHGTHRYWFTVYALDRAALPIHDHCDCRDLVEALAGRHVLDQGDLVGTYAR